MSDDSVLFEINLSNVMDDKAKAASTGFSLEKAVCNHGLFMMAPNKWIPSLNTLQRPLRLADAASSAIVSIYHPPSPNSDGRHSSLLVRVHDVDSLSAPDKTSILNQVTRMLRLSKNDENVINQFHQIHPRAKTQGFGRLFRSPTLFEDMVKSILFCNCNWGRTLKMAQALCDLDKELGNFPTCRELAHILFRLKNNNDDEIQYHSLRALRGALGYRVKHIKNVVHKIENGQLGSLELFDSVDGRATDSSSLKELLHQFKQVRGVGPFVAANVSMFLGFYETVPVDTETVCHFRQVHEIQNCDKKNVNVYIKQFYHKFSPFQSLAYWLEHLEHYEKLYGKLSLLPSSSYALVTSSSHDSINKYIDTEKDKISRKGDPKASSTSKKAKKQRKSRGWGYKFEYRS